MALETGVTYIEDLVATNPIGGVDTLDESDNHHRITKTAIQGSFPSLGAAAVTKTAAEINALASTTDVSNAVLVVADDIDERFRGIAVTTTGGIRVSSGSFSVVRNSTGTYTITHSKGDSNYTISATVENSSTATLTASFANEGTASFVIDIKDTTNTKVDAEFHITMIGW